MKEGPLETGRAFLYLGRTLKIYVTSLLEKLKAEVSGFLFIISWKIRI